MTYLTNTAAAVRHKGVQKAAELAKVFSNDWIMNDFIPEVRDHFGADKKGYNYRICCLNSL